jgi:hypothetical protein
MAQLGRRLFFLTMEARHAPTTDSLVAMLQGKSYKEQLGVCRETIQSGKGDERAQGA